MAQKFDIVLGVFYLYNLFRWPEYINEYQKAKIWQKLIGRKVIVINRKNPEFIVTVLMRYVLPFLG